MGKLESTQDDDTGVLGLLELALETHKDEYKDIWETWQNLDSKAQGSGAIAGVFLAGVFAWIDDLPSSFGDIDKGLLAAGVVLLVVAIGCAVAALQIRTVPAPPFGDETWDMIKDLMQPENRPELKTRLPAFFNDQVNSWRASNKELLKQTRAKASWMTIAQWSLLAAAVCVAILALCVVF